MAKIAGRKNDGAWFRWNQWILNQSNTVITTWQTELQNTVTVGFAFTIIQQYLTDVGADPTLFPATLSAWCQSLSGGIPRQMWDGVTTYDFYQESGETGAKKYTKLMQPAIFAASIDIRKKTKTLRFSSQELTGLAALQTPIPVAARAADESRAAFKARRLAEVQAWQEANPDKVAEIQQRVLTRIANTSKSMGLANSVVEKVPAKPASKKRT